MIRAACHCQAKASVWHVALSPDFCFIFAVLCKVKTFDEGCSNREGIRGFLKLQSCLAPSFIIISTNTTTAAPLFHHLASQSARNIILA